MKDVCVPLFANLDRLTEDNVNKRDNYFIMTGTVNSIARYSKNTLP